METSRDSDQEKYGSACESLKRQHIVGADASDLTFNKI